MKVRYAAPAPVASRPSTTTGSRWSESPQSWLAQRISCPPDRGAVTVAERTVETRAPSAPRPGAIERDRFMYSGICRPFLILAVGALASACGGARTVSVTPDASSSATDSASSDRQATEDLVLGMDRAATGCTLDRDCADTDPCTVNERCDSAARVCRTDTLDGDGDRHSPGVCGGGDCDDGNAQVFLGAAERCNGVDDDCDGLVDGAAATLACASGGSGTICAGGACACETPGRVLCGDACRDLATDTAHCGRCGNVCHTGEMCRAGVCSGPVIEGPACEIAPTRVSSRMVFEGLTGARDFVFDGRGGVAVAQGSAVVLRRAGETTPVTMVMAGEVIALRYTRASGLALAVLNDTDAGAGSGAIYVLAPGSTTPTLRHSGLRQPGGLAVDAMDRIWFSDTAMNTVYRMPAVGAAAQAVVTDVPSPTHLLVDTDGRYLVVATTYNNSVMRLELGSGGAIGAATVFVGGFGRVSGLAQDECGNVLVADEITDRIWRVPLAGGESVRLLMDVHGPRSLGFGVGEPFGPREIYALSAADGTLRAANLVARGVPLVVPAP
ncbi:MAG: hypothetical protein EPO40_05335 [Myxococcaceae bacterium]|nr:MAG: hypothetical protein EPO40_05335 [Myxococcaceae bacterium]